MGKLIRFPHPQPERRWSPAEILAIPEPLPNAGELTRQERSRIATTKKVAAEADKREKKRARRKRIIADILDAGGIWTIALLMRLVGDRTGGQISRATVTELLKELEAEGQACNNDQFWWKPINK